MADLISKEAFKRKLYEADCVDKYGFVNCGITRINILLEQSAVDAVSREVLEQIKWERDVAMEQLDEHGISFGAKTPDCEGCLYSHRKRPQKCSCCRRNRDLKDCYERREENAAD